jgi:hypothetical protein
MKSLALLAVCGLAAAAMFAPVTAQSAYYTHVCRKPVQAVGHGQAIEPGRFDFGVGYAKRQARHRWAIKVTQLYGHSFSYLARARHVTYSVDRGAGQIYVTLTASPCR